MDSVNGQNPLLVFWGDFNDLVISWNWSGFLREGVRVGIKLTFKGGFGEVSGLWMELLLSESI